MVNLLKVGVVFMKKSIRLLLSFLSFSLLFFSCSNNLESNSLVISFNLQNQNVQRTAGNQENLNVTVTLYDVLTTENNLQNLADFKIIETQTVPIVNNKALVQFDNVQIGTNALITAQITKNNQIVYEGKSEIFTVTEGKNSITINLRPYSGVTEILPEDPQNPRDLSYNADDGILEIYTEEGLKTFRDIVHGALTENIIVSENVVYLANIAYPTVNAKLCSDIALTETEWEPIGYYKNDNDNKAYNGIFDGNGKCVTGLKITTNYSTDLGFFGYVQDATIMNLYVQGNITCNSPYNIGGIVGFSKSSDNKSVTISNCINNVEITNDNSSYSVGGILGWSSGVVNINSCVNIAEITNGYSVAGILGYGDYNVTINNCLNLGSITMNGSYNAVAGIANLGQNDLNSVFTSINASQLTATGQNKNIYPISHFSPVLYDNYYDSTRLPTVTAVDGVIGIPSSDLGTLSLEGWDNDVSDSKYPIPSTIKNTFYNSSCWSSISDEVLIPENTTPDIPSQYVPGAYFVNGDTGNDGNDGSSIDTPKKNLTNVITSLKNSTENPTKTIYIDGTLTAESQGVTETSKKTLVTINDQEFGEDNKITLIGIHDATIDAQRCGRFIETDANFYMKMQNLTIKNGWTSSTGGALWFYKSSLELDECVIKGCVSDYNFNDGKDKPKYTGILMSGDGSVLKMTNTTCENSIYLTSTEATIGSNCTIGTANLEATDGFITLDVSTLILDGKNIDINKPIYVQNRTSSIQIGNDYSHGEPITIKLSSTITDTYSNLNPYTLIPNCDATKSNYFTIECEDSTKTATLGADGNITVN